MPTRIKPKSPLDAVTLARLESVRIQLLRLHKTLLDDERAAYEKKNGPIGGPNQVLNLVMSDPWFNWLHTISKLIVRIDELQEDAEGTEARSDALMTEAREMVLAKDPEAEFTKAYRAALQRSSSAVMAHAEVLKAFRDD